jgi:hypothetical protein
MPLFFHFISFLKDKGYQRLLLVSAIIVCIGTFVYHYLEGWTWLDACYFSIITLTTIGYGDIPPKPMVGSFLRYSTFWWVSALF